VWTDADWDQMGWHDASIHAMAVDWDPVMLGDQWRGADVLLDIDYIVAWLPRADGWFTFEVAPATLVFEDAWDLRGGLDHSHFVDPPEILELHRAAVGDGEWDWHVEGATFDLRLKARRLRQHFRARPVGTGTSQRLSTQARGGFSFARPESF
jgi:hypothetical protein